MKKLFLFLNFIIITATINAQDTLQQYTGKYIFPDGSVVPEVDVAITDGALYMSSVAGTSSLVQIGIDSFSVTEFTGIAVFKRGDDNKVNGVHIEAMGYILDGKKQGNGIWIFSAIYKKESFSSSLRRK